VLPTTVLANQQQLEAHLQLAHQANIGIEMEEKKILRFSHDHTKSDERRGVCEVIPKNSSFTI
jgi:hypothetical protein